VEPIVVVGLGNPGTEYEATRHNVGFDVVTTLAARWKKPFRPGRGDYQTARASIGGKQVVLVKPLTYMNNSGLAVEEVLARENAGPGSLLVVVDDIALPLGTLRIRHSGSDGGHNGLYSIIYQLGTDAFPRLRCGVGPAVKPPKAGMPDFVLSRFEPGERATAEAMITRAADAVTEAIASGIATAMNVFNT
jgi:peptidyl-tRNA hydrolase, PTH1 family